MPMPVNSRLRVNSQHLLDSSLAQDAPSLGLINCCQTLWTLASAPDQLIVAPFRTHARRKKLERLSANSTRVSFGTNARLWHSRTLARLASPFPHP
eukprot:1586585-Rhodomonas_salina.1